MNQSLLWLGLSGQGRERSRGGIVSAAKDGAASCDRSGRNEADASAEDPVAERQPDS